MIPPAFEWRCKRLTILGDCNTDVLGLSTGINWTRGDRVDAMITLGPIYLGITFDLTHDMA
jgi:hypothetical protein